MSDTRTTILIVDNDEGMAAALRTRIESAGYRCRTASGGAQGLSIFLEDRIDLVITDLNMPAGDGIAVVEAVREHRPVPVIVITGFRADYRRDLRVLADVTVLEKPFNSHRLFELIEAELALAGCDAPA
jgi:two-component system response regulator GlrR